MSKVDNAARQLLKPGESQAVAVFKGDSIGLGDNAKNPLPGVILVTDTAVIVAWEKLGLVNKGVAERFEASEIRDVGLEYAPLPGTKGAMQARGLGNARPTIRLMTAAGPFSLFFKRGREKEAESARARLARLSS